LNLFNVKENSFFLGEPTLEDVSQSIIQDKTRPMTMNLLAAYASGLPGFAGGPENSAVQLFDLNEQLFNKLFDKQNNLKIENYQLYILFLCLYGKVYYLKGFEKGAVSIKYDTPSSLLNPHQVKSKLWEPLTLSKINSLNKGELLYCKIELYDSGRQIDRRFIDLFKEYGYGQYNSHFYITGDVSMPIPGTTLPPRKTPAVITTGPRLTREEERLTDSERNKIDDRRGPPSEARGPGTRDPRGLPAYDPGDDRRDR